MTATHEPQQIPQNRPSDMYDSFETGTVPSSWWTGDDAGLAVVRDRCKEGERALEWHWERPEPLTRDGLKLDLKMSPNAGAKG